MAPASWSDPAWLLSAGGFALAMSVTPGPNNAMVTASGATFGYTRTLPHIIGISVGFPVMIVAVALGAGTALQAHPEIYRAMHWVGAAYLLYLAASIALARPAPADAGEGPRGRPLTFLQAALFQWVNPKAWLIVLGALVTYAGDGARVVPAQVAALAILFLAVCVPSCSLWTAIGAGAARLLRTPRALRAFNLMMAALLVASLVPMLGGGE
jgi:threonine/homoserine/homoserine lactone efflux protein